jgi:hypothetical protein
VILGGANGKTSYSEGLSGANDVTDLHGEHRAALTSVSEDDAIDLVATREGAAYLLDLLTRTARPGRGAAPLLRALGQLGKSETEARQEGRAHWFSGSLVAEIVSAARGLTIDLSAERSDGTRTRLFERMFFEAPFDELRWMIERVPELAGPLKVRAAASRFDALTLFVPRADSSKRLAADDTSKIVVSPESLIDPDSTSPVPALMAELAVLSRGSNVDPLEL